MQIPLQPQDTIQGESQSSQVQVRNRPKKCRNMKLEAVMPEILNRGLHACAVKRLRL